jgi:uncharacterized membrane protein
MADESPREDQLRQIIQRLDYLEFALRDQIARLYAVERHLGLAAQTEMRNESPPAAPPVERMAAPAEPRAPMIERSAPPRVVEPERPRGAAQGLGARDLETRIGGGWFNRIGIVAIIVGTGLFLKLAFEREWVGPAARVLIGVALGVGFLLGGERLRSKGYRHYAQGLSGGGIALLYLAFFAAFARYNLIGQGFAFLLMSGVTTLAVVLAARYDALAIAVLGLIGGFLTPALLSTGVDNQVGLFSYVALLDLGVLAVAYFKQWRALSHLAFGATVLMAAAWMIEWYAPEKLWTTVFFLTLLFVIFALLAVFHNIVRRSPAEWPEIALVFANALLYFTATYALLAGRYRPYLGLFAVLLSAFYVGFGYLAYTRDREDNYLMLTFLGLATLFLTLALPIQFDQHWVTMGWAVEGAILVWIGLRADSFATRAGAAGVFAVAVLHWLMFDAQEFGRLSWGAQKFVPIFNLRAVSAFAVITSFALAAWHYRRAGRALSRTEISALGGGYLLAANALAVILLSLEANDYWEQQVKLASEAGVGKGEFEPKTPESASGELGRLRVVKQFVISLIWTVYGGALLFFGMWRGNLLLRVMALLLLGVAIIKVFFFDLASLDRVYRIVSFILLGATLLGVSFLYQRRLARAGERG